MVKGRNHRCGPPRTELGTLLPFLRDFVVELLALVIPALHRLGTAGLHLGHERLVGAEPRLLFHRTTTTPFYWHSSSVR